MFITLIFGDIFLIIVLAIIDGFDERKLFVHFVLFADDNRPRQRG